MVILSASKEQEDILRSYALGANGYVRKPVDFAEFGVAATVLATFTAADQPHPTRRHRAFVTSSVRILLVEDSPSDSKLVVRALQKIQGEVRTERVEDAAAMRAALEGASWDIIVSDWSLPKFSGLEALRLMKTLQFDIPFLIVSGTIGEESAVEAMREGAADFLLKENLGRLAPVVERELQQSKSRRAKRASEARLSGLWESGVIGIAVTDVDGHVLEINDACLTMVGYSREEILSGATSWSELTPPEGRAADVLAAEQLKAHKVVPVWEKELKRKDGTRISVMVGVALLDPRTSIICLTDVSARRKVQVALRRTEEQLRQAQKMEAIGLLAGGVAHDFNNLLTVILSYAEMMTYELQENDPMRAEIKEITIAGQSAPPALTRQLLAFSRQQLVAPRVLDVNEVLKGMAKMLRRLIGEDIELHHDALVRAGDVQVRRGPARAGRDESARERARCHADRRQAFARDLERRARRAVRE